MDLKNTIAAVSLSAAVIIVWGLFFVEPPKNKDCLLSNNIIYCHLKDLNSFFKGLLSELNN